MPRMLQDGSKNLDLVSHLHNLVREHPDFEALHEPTLNSYCFRYVPNGLAERQEAPKVKVLLDDLNEEIVQAVKQYGFEDVETIRVQGRAAIRVSFDSTRTLLQQVEATFDAIARWGRLLHKKLSDRYKQDMEKSYV